MAHNSAISKRHFQEFAKSIGVERATTWKSVDDMKERTLAKKEVAAVKIFDTICHIMLPGQPEKLKQSVLSRLERHIGKPEDCKSLESIA